MPLNSEKIISIILEKSQEIEERCDGYREEIVQLIVDILEYERGHRISPTNIQQRINDKCDATASFLVQQRGDGADSEDKS